MKTTLMLCMCSLFLMTACMTKKDRLTADTFTITIDPSLAQTLAAGSPLTLQAICRSAKSDSVDVNPTWSVENNLGTFNPASGRSTVFTAGTSSGTAKIYATYGAIRGSVDVSVTVTNPGGGGGDGGGGSDSYVILADAGASTELKDFGGGNIFSYFDGGDGSPDAALWTIGTADASPGYSADSVKCVKVDYTDGAGYWGGFWVEFASAKDMATYNNLTFYVKGSAGGEKFIVKTKGGSVESPEILNTSFVTVTTSWQKVTIPKTAFTGVNFSQLQIPFLLAFNNTSTPGTKTIYIDMIQWEK